MQGAAGTVVGGAADPQPGAALGLVLVAVGPELEGRPDVLALAVVNEIAEDAHPHADYAMSMADKTQDKEVVIAANLASGAYHAGVEHFDEAITRFEAAFNADRAGPSAPLALILFGEAKISMAFDADDNLAKPQELDSAATSFQKARDLAASQPENAALVGRATIGMAAVARYKGDNKKACELLK